MGKKKSKKKTRQIPRNDEGSLSEIKLSELHLESIRQDQLVQDYAIKKADAVFARDAAKSKVKLVEAKLSLAIREAPEDFGLDKPTEKAVDAAITCDAKYQAAVTKVLITTHRVHILDALCSALEHRKKSLEHLVYLHSQSYYSTPRSKRGR